MPSAIVDRVLLVVPGLIWGASFLFIAEGLEAVAPNGVTFTRIAIGFLALSLFPSARRPVARADWAGTAALGVLWLAFPLSMFPFAEQHVSLMWRALGVALVITAPLGLPEVLKGEWTLRPALALLCLGAGGTAIANILTATAAGRMGATTASATAFLIPVVALILGVVIRHESISAVSLLGAAICLLGAAMIRDPNIARFQKFQRFPNAWNFWNPC